MNREVQLHDCEITAISFRDSTVSIVLSTAYIHESTGIPGIDPGVVWTQGVTLTFSDTQPVTVVPKPPLWVLDGRLTIGEAVFDGFIPADCHAEKVIEFYITLTTEDGCDAGTFTVVGKGITIERCGERSNIGEFNGPPRR